MKKILFLLSISVVLLFTNATPATVKAGNPNKTVAADPERESITVNVSYNHNAAVGAEVRNQNTGQATTTNNAGEAVLETKEGDIPSILIQNAAEVIFGESISAKNFNSKELKPIFTVTPNPFSQILQCRYQVIGTGKVVLRLINVGSGQNIILKEETAVAGIYNLQVNTSRYPIGVYILQLVQADEKQTLKVVKLN